MMEVTQCLPKREAPESSEWRARLTASIMPSVSRSEFTLSET